MKTKIINFISGPSGGKSIITSETFVQMKVRGHSVEIVPEYAKKLVWDEDWELLNDQYYVSNQQFKLLQAVYEKMPFVITDGSLLHGLVYNKINPDNTSNIEKTERAILDWFNKFDNIVIFLERNNDVKYETAGRIQNEDEAKKIDKLLKEELLMKKIPFYRFDSDLSNVFKICNLIEGIK